MLGWCLAKFNETLHVWFLPASFASDTPKKAPFLRLTEAHDWRMCSGSASVLFWNTAKHFALLMGLAQLKNVHPLMKLSSIPRMYSTYSDYSYVEHLFVRKWSTPHINSPSPGVSTLIQIKQRSPDVLNESKSLISTLINPKRLFTWVCIIYLSYEFKYDHYCKLPANGWKLGSSHGISVQTGKGTIWRFPRGLPLVIIHF